jgi:hypothetical protein
MKVLEAAVLVIGVLEGILGVVYLIFRWEPRWIGRGRPWAFTQGLTDIFASVFLVGLLLPRVADWHGVTASALTSTATVAWALFVGLRLVPVLAKRHKKRSLQSPRHG